MKESKKEAYYKCISEKCTLLFQGSSLYQGQQCHQVPYGLDGCPLTQCRLGDRNAGGCSIIVDIILPMVRHYFQRISWMHWDASSVMYPGFIGCFRSHNIIQPRPGHPAGVNQVPTCVPVADHGLDPLKLKPPSGLLCNFA